MISKEDLETLKKNNKSSEEFLRFCADVDIAYAEHSGHLAWLNKTYAELSHMPANDNQKNFLDLLQKQIVSEGNYLATLKKTRDEAHLIRDSLQATLSV